MCQRVPSESLLCPLVTLEEDNVWKWNSLSQIVQQINQSPYWTAQLLTPDGPAVRLCRQQNDAQQMPYVRSDGHRYGDDLGVPCALRSVAQPGTSMAQNAILT